MPTISQLPPADAVSATDEVPISQAGTARSASVGELLASVQPVITVDSASLLGRTSMGSGGPEQVDLGLGVSLSGGTLVADGLDHAAFAVTPSLSLESDLVISNQGVPTLMQAALLRGLFAAGQNVAIDANGVISTIAGTVGSASSIGALSVVTELSSQDLVAVSQSGTNCAITYCDFVDGITIDEAQSAGVAADPDTTWVAQGSSNVMARQTFAAIWVWIASKLPTYRAPVVEIEVDTNLDAAAHNGRLLICSQPLTLTPLTPGMGNGFQCTVINASAGNVVLGPGFISSSGSLVLSPWQSATLSCATYSTGTVAFAAMPTAASSATLVPGQVIAISSSSPTSSTITASWQAPSSGGAVSSYIVQYRPTGTTPWSGSSSVMGVTVYELTALQAATSYDIIVQAQNAAGSGPASSILTAMTSSATGSTVPSQVVGLAANSTSSSSVQLSWSTQSGSTPATSFTVYYRVTGSSDWTTSVTAGSASGTAITGLQAATSYDFEVVGLNSSGTGPASIVTVGTLAVSQLVTSITWNLLPNGTYTHGSGTIGLNAHVSPSSSQVQFGFSLSASIPPLSWTAANLVNSDLWGAYVPTPGSAGNWYVWGEGLDGSAPTVSPSPFTVQ